MLKPETRPLQKNWGSLCRWRDHSHLWHVCWAMESFAEWHVMGQKLSWMLSCRVRGATLAAVITWPVCYINIIRFIALRNIKQEWRLALHPNGLTTSLFLLPSPFWPTTAEIISLFGGAERVHFQPALCYSFWWNLYIAETKILIL